MRTEDGGRLYRAIRNLRDRRNPVVFGVVSAMAGVNRHMVVIDGAEQEMPAVGGATAEVGESVAVLIDTRNGQPIGVLGALNVGVSTAGVYDEDGWPPGTILHEDLPDVTPNQHHAQVHALVGPNHTVGGLTPGHFLKATGETTFGFVPHGLTYSDVGAAAVDHNHDGVYSPVGHGHAWADVSKVGSSLADLATRAHSDLTGVSADQHHAQSHVLAGAAGLGPYHIVSGLTAGHVLRASGAAAAAFAQLQHGDVGGVSADQHHAQSHVLDGGNHTVSGLTAGHFLKATSPTTFAFAAHGLVYSDVGAAAVDHGHAQLHDQEHALVGADHTASGLTVGHILTATGAGTFAFQAPAAGPHNLLSAQHSDTVTAAAAQGALVYGNATPAWAALAIGGANSVLTSDGTDIAWSASLSLTELGIGCAPSYPLDVAGTARVGVGVGEGGDALIFGIERKWAFRQFGTGSTTALQLICTDINKAFHIDTDGYVDVRSIAGTVAFRVDPPNTTIYGGLRVAQYIGTPADTDLLEFFSGALNVHGHLNITPGYVIGIAASDIITDIGTGSKIGTAANQKFGFWGATPVVQRSHIPDPVNAPPTMASNRAAIVAILLALEQIGFLADA